MYDCMHVHISVCVRASGGSPKGWDEEFGPQGPLAAMQ